MTYYNITFTQRMGTTPCIIDWCYANTGVFGNIAHAQGLVDYWIDTVMPLINAVQSDQIANDLVSIRGDDNNVSYEAGATGTGAVTATSTETLPPFFPMVIRKNAGTTVLRPTLGTYSGNRPIKRGRIFLSGFTKEWVDEDGINIPAASATAFSALLTGLLNSVVVAGATWTPSIIGLGLPELDPSPTYPSGKPARPTVGAPITSIQARRFTKLSSRED